MNVLPFHTFPSSVSTSIFIPQWANDGSGLTLYQYARDRPKQHRASQGKRKIKNKASFYIKWIYPQWTREQLL